MEIKTPRLTLVRFSSNDFASLMDLFTHEEVMASSMGIMTEAEVEEWLDRAQKVELPFAHLAIRYQNQTIGYAGLQLDDAQRVAVGYRLRRQFWGQGLATEAVKYLLDWAWTVIPHQEIIATIEPINKGSIAVVKKLNFSLEGQIMLPGYSHPDDVYVLKRPDAN